MNRNFTNPSEYSTYCRLCVVAISLEVKVYHIEILIDESLLSILTKTGLVNEDTEAFFKDKFQVALDSTALLRNLTPNQFPLSCWNNLGPIFINLLQIEKRRIEPRRPLDLSSQLSGSQCLMCSCCAPCYCILEDPQSVYNPLFLCTRCYQLFSKNRNETLITLKLNR